MNSKSTVESLEKIKYIVAKLEINIWLFCVRN